MSYSKSVFFIPVWFEHFKPFAQAMASDDRWAVTESKKTWAGYLFRYASDLNRSKDLFASFTLKDPSVLKVQMFTEKLGLERPPIIEEVRMSCFATGVGFMEFWVTYTDMTPAQVANFSYEFKKATTNGNKPLPNGQKNLNDTAQSLLPQGVETRLFFAVSAYYKQECNCFHFFHLDGEIPDEETRRATLYRLSRSYRETMPVAVDSDYDMMYQAGEGDFWAGSSEGLVNIVYDNGAYQDPGTDYFYHTLKPRQLQKDYYFMYLLLLHQKYAAVEYIRKVACARKYRTKELDDLNQHIILLKNTFSFNVVSDDSVVQNVYSRMYAVLKIRNLLEDVIENEKQMDYIQKAKQTKAERFSSKCLVSLSILSLFSALIDAAGYFDRFVGGQLLHTALSIVVVFGIATCCVIWGICSMRE